MSSDVVETVSIRLVSDASELLDGVEEAIADVEAAGDQAGQAFVDSMTEEMREAGEQVRQIAGEMFASFEEAAQQLADSDLFEAFSVDQLSEFAYALEEMEEEFKETGMLAGEALALGFDETAALAGEEVRQVAEEMKLTFEEAAAAMERADILEAFKEEEILAFADALEEMGIPLGRTEEHFQANAQALEVFNAILRDAGFSAATAKPSFEGIILALAPENFLAIASAIKEVSKAMNVTFEDAADTMRAAGETAGASAEQFEAVVRTMSQISEQSLFTTGEQAGKAFAEGFGESAAQVGQFVRIIADRMEETFQEAAETFAGGQWLQGFSPEQAAAFAQGLEQIEAPLTSVADALELTEGQLAVFGMAAAEVLSEMEGGATTVEEIAEAFGNLGEHGDRFVEAMNTITGNMADFTEGEGLDYEKLIELLDQDMREFGKISEETVEHFEAFAEATEESGAALELANAQVGKVVAAFQELGVEIPNALQRERIRAYVLQLSKMADEFSDVEKEADQFTDALIDQQKKMGGLRGAIADVTGGFDIFGVSVGQLVSGLGVAAVALILVKTAVGAIINQIKESIDVALSFAEAYRDLALAIRVNSVAGEENTRTFKDWQTTAEAVSELANTSLQIGMETVTVALRELGAGTELSDKQLNDLILTGSRFAELYGLDLPAGINRASRFITEGLADSLRGLGLELDKTAQNQKAWELRLGTSIDKLDENTQEFVRYMLVLDQMRDRVDAAGEGFETLTDRMDKFEQRQEIAKKTLGAFFLPFAEGFEKLKTGLSEFFTAFLGLILLQIADWGATVIARVISIVAAFQVLKDNLDEGIGPALEAAGKTMAEAFDEAKLQLMQEAAKRLTGSMDEYEQSAGAAGDTTDDLADSIGNLADMVDKFIEESVKFDAAMAKIGRKLADSLADIETQFQTRRAKAEADFQRDLRDIDQDAAIDRLDTIREYQIDEIRLREDHSKDIRQLEERFLLDLEDAVRDRDARRVLQLQRRFNLEKKRREEDFGLRNKRLKEDFQIELQEIARQRLIRRQERALSFQEEMMDLVVQETARQDAARARARRAERELLEAIRSRLLLVEAANEGLAAVNQELLDNLVNALIENFGPDGPWVLWHQEAVKTVQGAAEGIADADHQIIRELAKTEARIRNHLLFMQAAAAQAAQIGARTTSAFQAGGGGGVFEMRQRGGTFFATSPTMVSAGEGRPERVDITPLSAATGRPSAGYRGGGGQDKMQIDLRVEASEQLVVEVADQTMSEVADVFVTISQRGFQGGRGA